MALIGERQKVNVIAAVSGASALAAKAATKTIPIVFMTGTDPVADGLIASLARPGGNLTGISFLFFELHGKRLDLLSELVPKAKVIALLVNPNFAPQQIVQNLQGVVQARGLRLLTLKAGTEAEIDAAFATLDRQHADALLVGSDPFFDSRCEQIVAQASREAIPAMYPWRLYTDAGGLISYGTSLPAVYRQLGDYTGEILKGKKPTELPVQQPTKFELVLNLKTAKALRLEVPARLLATADVVIE